MSKNFVHVPSESPQLRNLTHLVPRLSDSVRNKFVPWLLILRSLASLGDQQQWYYEIYVFTVTHISHALCSCEVYVRGVSFESTLVTHDDTKPLPEPLPSYHQYLIPISLEKLSVKWAWQNPAFPQPHLTGANKLTLWGRVTQKTSVQRTNIASDNGLSPVRRQAIIWTIDVILSKKH